ncbi:MAG: succinyl-diaminopimelate desuccinylase [Candidatus Marinimicrobia bacterium]|nr:succinyl-diaminopimelate desuccinylase [Candidatus Neomarinimicrobiota bacterium]
MSSQANITDLVNGLELARALIRCPSMTPKNEGALDVLQGALETLGFDCHRLVFDGDGSAPVDNLYARLGNDTPNFCFAGHTDVVPVGEGWTVDPFAAEVLNGRLFGRGAADMKGAIAAFVAAVARMLKRDNKLPGSISLLITGDEEGDAINGTKKVLSWLSSRSEKLDACLVGEPTNPTKLGEMIKIGRRGSLTAKLTTFGTQGHVAYPHLADNPIPRLFNMLQAITANPLDQGSEHFPASTISITTVDVGNTASNVIPRSAQAAFNIRFNDLHTSNSLNEWLRTTLNKAAEGSDYDLSVRISGESFLTPPGSLSEIVSSSIKHVLGITPNLSTTGGTSDARFIKDACPVCEFGMVGLSMHKADENCTVSDLNNLTKVYLEVLDQYFALNAKG